MTTSRITKSELSLHYVLGSHISVLGSHISGSSMAYKLGNGKTWVLISVTCFLLFFVHMTIGLDRFVDEIEVDKLLNKMNKPAVKTIQV